jgi:hypothetical protein
LAAGRGQGGRVGLFEPERAESGASAQFFEEPGGEGFRIARDPCAELAGGDGAHRRHLDAVGFEAARKDAGECGLQLAVQNPERWQVAAEGSHVAEGVEQHAGDAQLLAQPAQRTVQIGLAGLEMLADGQVPAARVNVLGRRSLLNVERAVRVEQEHVHRPVPQTGGMDVPARRQSRRSTRIVESFEQLVGHLPDLSRFHGVSVYGSRPDPEWCTLPPLVARDERQ